MKIQTYKDSFHIRDVNNIIKGMSYISNNITTSWKNRREYYNIPVAFDIETSSFEINGNPYANMYIWQMAIGELIVYGRKWDEWLRLLDYISSVMNLGKKRLLSIYVHNLSYEMGFIGNYFKWDNILAIKPRRPIRATSNEGFDFRCSYYLSGLSLAKIGENLKSGSRKKEGDLDYSKLRHSSTPLTEQEMDYCISDVIVLRDYIKDQMDIYNNIANIPNTKTGVVRRYFRQNIFSKRTENMKSKLKYKDLMKELIIDDIQEFNQLKNGFSGGFTHCNPFYSQQTYNNISLKIDFTSSYPYVMSCENRFPMSKGKYIKKPTLYQFYNLIKEYCCIFTVIFIGLESKFSNENYISASKCRKLEMSTFPLNNGRVIEADRLSITICEIDFEIIEKTYKWKELYIIDLYYYKRDYLPKQFVSCLLDLYETKTKLKGVSGKEDEYNVAKQNTNSSYGMMATNFIRDLIKFINGAWSTVKLTEKEIRNKINEYNEDEDRFLFYPWAIYTTALARRNLWLGIMSVGEDYIYADTDSLVIANPQKHIDFVKKYNSMVYNKLKKSAKHFDLPLTKYSPKTINNEEKPLGVWDIEDICLRFKSIGAKRYLVEIPSKEHKKDYKNALETILSPNPDWDYFESFRISGKKTQVKLTVAGVSKKYGVKYLDRFGHDKAFEKFSNDLVIPSEFSGKQILTYCNWEQSGELIDYLGNKGTYHEKSCIHMKNSEYSFSIDDEYVDMMLGIFAMDMSV